MDWMFWIHGHHSKRTRSENRKKSCFNIALESAEDKLQNAYKNRIIGNNWKYVMTWTLSTLLIEIFRFFFLTKWGVDKKGFPIVCSEFNSLSEKKVKKKKSCVFLSKLVPCHIIRFLTSKTKHSSFVRL